jgi:[protein-PII] uridylyltransferase
MRPRLGSGSGPVRASASASWFSTSDRSGLLYAIARVLAKYHINLQLAKITTLGERVEDTFLVDGSALQQNRLQLEIESELLDAITP